MQRLFLWLSLAAIHGVLLYNALFHDMRTGYDVHHHLKNVEIYAELRFPTAEESAQFFSAPLPYLLPAMLHRAGLPFATAKRIALLGQVLMSGLLFYYLLKLCEILSPKNNYLKLSVVLLLGMLPVYYKSFAFFRGEPYVAFFSVYCVYQLVTLFSAKTRLSPVHLGVALALLILSRQWGVFAGVGIALAGLIAAFVSAQPALQLRRLIAAGTIAGLGGGWFYLSQTLRHDTVRAFNRPAEHHFSLSNQPQSFFLV